MPQRKPTDAFAETFTEEAVAKVHPTACVTVPQTLHYPNSWPIEHPLLVRAAPFSFWAVAISFGQKQNPSYIIPSRIL